MTPVHVFRSGRPLCGLPALPDGHKWVPLFQSDQATCGVCFVLALKHWNDLEAAEKAYHRERKKKKSQP